MTFTRRAILSRLWAAGACCWVGLLGACSFGSSIVCCRFDSYTWRSGVVGSLFTLALVLLPRTPAVFAVAFIGENVFQGLAITTSVAIAFETIGRRNPLAATTFCLLTSAFNIPITYMLFVDGWGYTKQGVAGSFAADASLGVIASVLLGALLIWVTRRRPLAPIPVTETS